ncbi:MAG TPA: magnesium and cobalt transport protein CorA [Micromonosporaceae bacterium]
MTRKEIDRDTRRLANADPRGITKALSAMTRILGTTPTRHSHDTDGTARGAIVDCAVYVNGRRNDGVWDYADALDTVRRTPNSFMWLGLYQPTARELGHIAETFELHELPVEDALQGHQRPKIERYPAMTFATLRTTRYVEHEELTDVSEIVETGHVMLFLGKDFVITVRHGAPTELASLRADLESDPDQLAEGPWAVAHRIYDRIVDTYVETAGQIELDIDQLEDSVFARDRRGSIQRIYQLKRELVEFKRAVLPLQRPVADIAGGHIADVPLELQRYFRDVNDNLSRTVDQVVSFDDLLNSILQARLAQVTVDQNDDMRKIAAWAGIAAVWTAIAGIYGMNFEFMPELHWRFGYPMVLAISLAASIILYRQFRKSGWL